MTLRQLTLVYYPYAMPIREGVMLISQADYDAGTATQLELWQVEKKKLAVEALETLGTLKLERQKLYAKLGLTEKEASSLFG